MAIGKQLIIDLYKGDVTKFNRESIKNWLDGLCELIDMKQEDFHFWDWEGVPADEILYDQPHLIGTSAVQFITTSNIVIHTFDMLGGCCIDIFSCKDYDPISALDFTKNWFDARQYEYSVLVRGKYFKYDCIKIKECNGVSTSSNVPVRAGTKDPVSRSDKMELTKQAKLSRLFGTGRCISFPAGTPPIGTCEFATKTCLRECAGRLSPFKEERRRYRLFCDMNSSELICNLRAEIMGGLYSGIGILSWFSESGDCPAFLTSKIIEVMRGLLIPQNGFTRNEQLWKLSQKIPNIRLALTVEDEVAGREYSKGGLVAIPDYNEERVKILRPEDIWLCGGGSVCGCGTVEHEDYETEEDCGMCYKLSRGCFAA